MWREECKAIDAGALLRKTFPQSGHLEPRPALSTPRSSFRLAPECNLHSFFFFFLPEAAISNCSFRGFLCSEPAAEYGPMFQLPLPAQLRANHSSFSL